MKQKAFNQLFVAALLLLPGCELSVPASQAPAMPARLWSPSEDLNLAQFPKPELTTSGAEANARAQVAELGKLPELVALNELIELALKSNPQTQASWYAAQAQYAALENARASYYPQVNLGAQINRTKRSSDLTSLAVSELTKSDLFAQANYLLFDFGNREAKVDDQRLRLLAANYAHNSAVQKVILQVQQAFYNYVSVRSVAKAFEVTVHDAQTNLDAAEQSRNAGLATIADVLQAKTALSKARYDFQASKGELEALRGAVLTSAGLPPSAKIDVAEVELDGIDAQPVREDVEALLKKTLEDNPELAAAKADAAQAENEVRIARTKGYPTFQASGQIDDLHRPSGSSTDYTYGVGVTFPLFTGFSYSAQLQQAKRQAQAAAANYKALEDQRSLDVWSDYYAFKTAAEQIVNSEDLLASAQASYDVSLGRYKEGLGSILDLLSAQSELAQARAAKVKARADWLMSLAKLRFDIGALGGAK